MSITSLKSKLHERWCTKIFVLNCLPSVISIITISTHLNPIVDMSVVSLPPLKCLRFRLPKWDHHPFWASLISQPLAICLFERSCLALNTVWSEIRLKSFGKRRWCDLISFFEIETAHNELINSIEPSKYCFDDLVN